MFLDALWDAVKDTLIVLPFLYVAYLLVSYFSHNGNEKYSKLFHKTKKAGPVIGAFLGSVPQCGFSSVMSQLYSKKFVTIGTLIAVFVATSDEAIPLMIAKPEFIPKLLILIAIKVVYAIIVGYIIDGIVRLFSKKNKVLNVEASKDNQVSSVPSDTEIDTALVEASEKDGHTHHCHHSHEDEGHDHSKDHCCAKNIFLDALEHTLIIIAYVFAATLIINLINVYCGGLEPLQKFFTDNVYIQILIASLIGLIPNCAASVFLVEMYMSGVLFFPALLAGLTAGAGVGLIVLFTTNYKKPLINLTIVLVHYALGFLIGIITNFIPIW